VAEASDLKQNSKETENDRPSKAPIKEVQEQTPLASSHDASTDSCEPHTTKATVLLVEDHFLVAYTNQFYLREIGCAVDIATTGQAALDQVAQKHFDLIFMDIGLPDREGTEVTKELRQSGWKGPIIGLTGHAKNPEYRTSCFEVGMNEVIGKPAEEEQLESLLKHWVFDKKEIKQDVLQSDLPVIDWEGCLNRHHRNISIQCVIY